MDFGTKLWGEKDDRSLKANFTVIKILSTGNLPKQNFNAHRYSWS